MRYLLLIYGAENGAATQSEGEQRTMMDEYFQYTEALRSAGVMQGGEALQPTTTATTVVDDGGKPLVTDGPFAETREQLGGYTIIEADDLDDALAIASGFIGTQSLASIEVRPIQDFEGVPATPERR